MLGTHVEHHAHPISLGLSYFAISHYFHPHVSIMGSSLCFPTLATILCFFYAHVSPCPLITSAIPCSYLASIDAATANPSGHVSYRNLLRFFRAATPNLAPPVAVRPGSGPAPSPAALPTASPSASIDHYPGVSPASGALNKPPGAVNTAYGSGGGGGGHDVSDYNGGRSSRNGGAGGAEQTRKPSGEYGGSGGAAGAWRLERLSYRGENYLLDPATKKVYTNADGSGWPEYVGEWDGVRVSEYCEVSVRMHF